MIEYALNGLQILVLGAVLLAALRNAPAKWRLAVSIAALIATVAPWHLLPPLQVPLSADGELGLILQSGLVNGVPTPQSLSIASTNSILAALLLGFAAFTVMTVRQMLQLKRWRSKAQRRDDLLRLVPTQARFDNCRLWIVRDSNMAGSTALPHPEIWIGEKFLSDPGLRTVVTHEASHVLAGDPALDWMLVFTRSLFWWHPLVWFWVWQAHRQMELACDERCASALGRREYQVSLATLIRNVSNFRYGVAMMKTNSFNMDRVRKLDRKPRLMAKHRAGMLVALLAGALSLVNLSANAQADVFELCPVDVETSSVTQTTRGVELGIELSDAAAARLSMATDGRVGDTLSIVDSRGTVLEGLSFSIRSPLNKNFSLVFDSEQVANRLQSYLEGNQCVYE